MLYITHVGLIPPAWIWRDIEVVITSRTRNAVVRKLAQGFESLSLRHKHLIWTLRVQTGCFLYFPHLFRLFCYLNRVKTAILLFPTLLLSDIRAKCCRKCSYKHYIDNLYVCRQLFARLVFKNLRCQWHICPSRVCWHIRRYRYLWHSYRFR